MGALSIPGTLCRDEFLDFAELAYPYLVWRVDVAREIIACTSGGIDIRVTTLDEHVNRA
ncbi:MAG: hypothetical protein OET46_05185 [Xanthomonadales bacterium]|nr:hypothetical protein [Xanthomonadales bacterium]